MHLLGGESGSVMHHRNGVTQQWLPTENINLVEVTKVLHRSRLSSHWCDDHDHTSIAMLINAVIADMA